MGSAVVVVLVALMFGPTQATITTSSLTPGDIFVTDDAFPAVLKIDPVSGTQTVVASGGDLVLPLGIAIGPDGNLYIADDDAFGGDGAVFRINPDTGTMETVSAGNLFVDPTGLTFDADGMILIADEAGSGAVIRVDPATGDQTLVSDDDLMEEPDGLVVDFDGNILVADADAAAGGNGAIIRIDPLTGNQELVSSGGNLVNPTGIALEADGTIVVADWGLRPSAEADGRVLRINPTTGVQTVVAMGGNLVDTSGVAIDSDGTFLVADFAKKVVRIDPDTGTQTVVSSGGVFRNPFGIVVVPPPPSRGCPGTPGFWKNHPDEWPVNTLILGEISYTKQELLDLLNTPGNGDASMTLGRHLIAAKLNVASGVDDTPVADTIADADDLLGEFDDPLPLGIKPNSPIGHEMLDLAGVLDEYNNGELTGGCS